MSFPWAQQYEPQAPLMRYLDEKLPLPRFVKRLPAVRPMRLNWPP